MPSPLDAFTENLSRLPAFMALVLFASIILFSLSIPGSMLTQRIMHRFKWKWVRACLAATYIEIAVLVLLVYFGLYLLPAGSVQTGTLPPELQFDAWNEFAFNASTFLFVLARNLLAAGVLAFLSFPFILLATFVQDFFSSKPRKWNPLIARGAGTLIATLALFFIVSLFPWTVTALVYLFFFAG